MSLAVFGKHLIRSQKNADGGTTSYYYYDEVIWIVATIALLWLTWFLIRRYRRGLALRRRPRGIDHKRLKRVVRMKQELSSHYLRRGFSRNIHAIGIGRLNPGGDYCIQFFVGDADAEMWEGSGGARLTASYRGVPLRLIEMPMATFLADIATKANSSNREYPTGLRDHQEVIIGGISGANLNLTGQSGTIGYFCTRKSKLPRRKDIHLLSNSHVFADLRKTQPDDGDLIMQPSPGETSNNRPIASLVNFSKLTFEGDVAEPNHVDAAMAKLWSPLPYKPVLPLIGAVRGYVEKKDIEIGEPARKFGRTTGYTEGSVFSIYLDIWIRYDRTGQSAFFQDQILIQPATPNSSKFVSKGDSGSLLVDSQQSALGLIFGGMSELPETLQRLDKAESKPEKNRSAPRVERIESYGVANPISEVLNRLKIDLLV
ncbi:MAG TPA: hypothetical protein VNO50_09640 [Pyrinomonadaceae bacterium]|nr:hypothetical protein [Pyrinomonadaceae bacterium]